MKKIILITAFVACTNSPGKPDSQIDATSAQEALKDLNEEVG
jgi:hypothetical protein